MTITRITIVCGFLLHYTSSAFGMFSVSIADDLTYLYTLYKGPQPAFPIKDLPIDIVTVVARHLSLQDQAFLAASCKRFETIHFYAAHLRLPLKPKFSFTRSMRYIFEDFMIGHNMTPYVADTVQAKIDQERKNSYITSVCTAIENRIDTGHLTINSIDLYNEDEEQLVLILNIMKKSNTTSFTLSTPIETEHIRSILQQCTALTSLELIGNFDHTYIKDLIVCLNDAPHVTTLSLKSDTMSQFEICKELAKNNHLKKIKLSGININHPVCIPRAMEEIEEIAGIYEGRLEDKYYLKYYPESIKRYGYNAFQKVKLRKDELDAFLEPHRKLTGAIEALMMSPHLEELDLSQNKLCDYLKNSIKDSPSKPNNLVVKL